MADSVTNLLRNNDFRFNKQFGQNFITDSALLDDMVAESGIESGDIVLEIGAGAGTLTCAIAKVARKVIAFELDRNLKKILDITLEPYKDKVDILIQDFMRVTDEELEELVGREYKVVANLPYYITTPIIMRLLESDNPPQSISIMVQKEVAERITSTPSHSDYGAITVSIDLVANASITRIVNRNMFYPAPNVDSAVLRIDYDKAKQEGVDIAKTKRVIKAAFLMRRKTLVNNLTMNLGLSRERAAEILLSLGLDERARGETLSTQQFIALARLV